MSSHRLLEKVDLSVVDKQASIIEIGCVRDKVQFENSESSTLYFDQLAKARGCTFLSVDFSKDSVAYARQIVGERAFHADGVSFLKQFNGRIGILYLDNFDIVYNEKHRQSLMSRVGNSYEENNEVITNDRSAQVHLEQMQEALPKMTKPCYVCIDDTMIRNGGWFGKGAAVVPFLLEKGFSIVAQSEDGVLMFSK